MNRPLRDRRPVSILDHSNTVMKSYQTYRDLPALAGIASFAQASVPGLSVEECVRRLKRYHYAFRRLHGIFIARLTEWVNKASPA